nr:hypothetical protein Y39B6B.a [imported] - Caenorhabditis elegans [Caenorhabditis elegans]
MAFCKALVLLRNQDMIDPIILMETFFELVKVEDKVLRKFLLSSISAHLKRVYHKKKDVKMLGKIQNLCFSKMKDSRSIVARAAQLVCIDAFRRKFWRDARTANVIAQACFHKVAKIQVTSMKFFLGSENENGDAEDSDEMDSDAEDNTKTLKEVMTSFRNVKKTRKREKNVERAKKMISKKKKAKKEGRSKECNLMAIQSLYDPQEFVDRLFGAVEAKKMDNFEVRLFKIALCARIIGIHRLHTLSFYSYLHRKIDKFLAKSIFTSKYSLQNFSTYLEKFLQPKQRDVTKILLYAAQACHEMVPPDTVEQLIRVIANNFVTDRNSPEAMTVGINAIREILSNCPFAATEELLRDLSEYKTYKNKNVSMAARSLITLFRAVNPKLLARKDRGKPQEKGTKWHVSSRIFNDEDEEYNGFARPKVHDFISGAEILDEDAADGEQGHLEEDGTDSELDVSDVDTDDVDTDDDADEPVAKKKRVEQKSVENDAESDADDEEIEDEEEMDDEEEEIEISDEEEEEIDDEAEEEAVVEEEASEAVEKDPKLKASKNSMDRIMTQEDFKNIKAYQLKKQLIGEKRLKKQMGKGRSQADERIVDEMAEKLELKRSSDGLARLSDIEHFYKKKRQSKEERMADVMAGRADEDYKFGRPKKNVQILEKPPNFKENFTKTREFMQFLLKILEKLRNFQRNTENFDEIQHFWSKIPHFSTEIFKFLAEKVHFLREKSNFLAKILGAHVGRTNDQNSKKKVFAMVKNKIRGRNRQRSFRDQQKSLRHYLMRQSGRKPQ